MVSLDSTRRYVIDGAMATELEARGANLNDTLWSARVLIESPQLIEAVHYDYYLAGADIALSASYQATFDGFAARGLSAAEARTLLETSIALACRARDRYCEAQDISSDRARPWVAASIGPYGAHRHDGSEYTGDYGVNQQRMIDFHRRQLEVLAQTAADLVAFETVPSLAEGEAIVRLLEEFPEVPAWLSFSCRNGEQVNHGESFARCVALANEHPGILATGLNCTPPEFVESLLQHAATATTVPLLAYPNTGETWCAADNIWQGASTQLDPRLSTRKWLDAGARLLGGCCRTTPADIRAIAEIVKRRECLV